MRIIAGKYRSRLLKNSAKLKLRPTSDRLRETLFNVLGPTLENCLFIDVFAGTGAVGIEALSRGAKQSIFIEKNTEVVSLIKQNLELLGAQNDAQVLEADAVRGLEKLSAKHVMADFIFIDPPYENEKDYVRALEFLDESHLVAPHGLVIVEHWASHDLPKMFARLELSRTIGQGDHALSLYRLAAAA